MPSVTDQQPAGRPPIRVLVADDHALFRRGLRTVLELDGDIVVVDEAEDGIVAVEKAEANVPDVVLMDVRMPRCGGIEACQAIKARVPSARIVMLTIVPKVAVIGFAARRNSVITASSRAAVV